MRSQAISSGLAVTMAFEKYRSDISIGDTVARVTPVREFDYPEAFYQHYMMFGHETYCTVNDQVFGDAFSVRCLTCKQEFRYELETNDWSLVGGTMTTDFTCDNVPELIGQVIGAASATRFWDQLPEDYPMTAGVFLDANGRELFDAAMVNYRKIESELFGPDSTTSRTRKACKYVYDYVKNHLDKTDAKYTTFSEDEVYVVWYSYILGGWKALVSTTLPDGMYYEVTYNSKKNEVYLDAYKKFENQCYPQGEVG
jgi:hypothetical protein